MKKITDYYLLNKDRPERYKRGFDLEDKTGDLIEKIKITVKSMSIEKWSTKQIMLLNKKIVEQSNKMNIEFFNIYNKINNNKKKVTNPLYRASNSNLVSRFHEPNKKYIYIYPF